MKKRDILLLVVAVAIIVFLWMAPEESTSHVPQDEDHQQLLELVKSDGKKAAEKFCTDCHNPDQVAFPHDHPTKARCLFCHKVN